MKVRCDKMTHLYELSTQYRFLTEALESEEFQEDQVKAKLSEITTQIQDKALNIGKMVLSYESDILALDAELSRLSKRRASAINRAEWLKSYLLTEMVVAGIDKVKGDVLNVAVQNNPPSVQIVNQDEIPSEYRREIPATWQPDKNKILTQFKTYGEIVSGVEIIRDKKRIVIK